MIFLTDQERATQHFPDNWEAHNLPGLTRLKKNGLTFNNAFTAGVFLRCSWCFEQALRYFWFCPKQLKNILYEV
ncbi:MAG: hypothetical protein ACKV1O_16760 [Saprospiraceae bacterium]